MCQSFRAVGLNFFSITHPSARLQISADSQFFQQTKLMNVKKKHLVRLCNDIMFTIFSNLSENKSTLPNAIAIICSLKKFKTAAQRVKPL